jgi:predicted N-acetyltransferase YhbS
MKIVAEAPNHRAEVMEINRLAFKGDTESRLIRKLDRDASVVASYVALDGDDDQWKED